MTDYFLDLGPHEDPRDGRCALEWVSYLAGERHTSEPACVSEVLRCYCFELNDSLPDQPRQKLRSYLARTIGTAGDGLDEQRAWMAADWLIRANAPAWLSLAGRDAAAERLRRLPPMPWIENLNGTMEDLRRARDEAHAARAIAKETAGKAAWAAAKAAAKAATGDAVRTAGGDAAGLAVVIWYADAEPSARDPAWDAARSARHAAAGAAWAAANTCAWAGAANAATCTPLAAATAALAPTVTELQDSALTLLDRMLPTVPLQAPVASTPFRGASGRSLARAHEAKLDSDRRTEIAALKPWSATGGSMQKM